MRRVLTLLVAMVFVVAVAGCGGGDEAASDTDTATVSETTTDETTTDETTTEETTTEETDGDLGDFAAGGCADLVAASQALGSALASAGTSGNDLTESSEAFQDFVDEVPEEIRADVQVLADAYAKYADALQDIDVQTGETPSAEDLAKLTQAMEAVDQAEVTAASQRLTAWATENCSTD